MVVILLYFVFLTCFQHFSNPRSDIVSLHNEEMVNKCGINSKEFTCAFEHTGKKFFLSALNINEKRIVINKILYSYVISFKF